MTSLLWHHLYLELSRSMQYLLTSFFHDSPSIKQHCKLRGEQTSSTKEICLNFKYQCFIFQRIVKIHLSIYPWSDHMRQWTAATLCRAILRGGGRGGQL